MWLRVRNKAPRKGSNKFVSNAKENGLVEESKKCVSWKKNSGEIPSRKMDEESPRL